MKIAELTYCGVMEWGGKRLELYNVRKLTSASDTLCIGSTVTLASIERAGFVPLVCCKLGVDR